MEETDVCIGRVRQEGIKSKDGRRKKMDTKELLSLRKVLKEDVGEYGDGYTIVKHEKLSESEMIILDTLVEALLMLDEKIEEIRRFAR